LRRRPPSGADRRARVRSWAAREQYLGPALGFMRHRRGRKAPVRGLRRRALATQYFTDGHAPGIAELLHVAVDDKTLRAYCRSMARFLDWIEAEGEVQPDWRTAASVDLALAVYLSALCFGRRKLAHEGGTALAAVLHFRPLLHGHMPLSARAAKAFRALVRPAERWPFSHTSMGAIVATLLLLSEVEAAIIVAYAYNVVGRGQQDWALPRLCDVHLPRSEREAIGVSIGRSDRGERAKTGHDQGVMVRCPLVCAWLRARVARLGPSSKRRLFSLSPQRYRELFSLALHELGLPDETPHIIRHTAASVLISRGAPLKEVMLAGRWGSVQSVRRYAKPHLLGAHESTVDPSVLALGDRFWLDPLAYFQRCSP
jgi:hypothetical protein